MPVSREEKEEQVEKLAGQFRSSQIIVWTEYRGLTMPRLSELRRALRQHQGQFHVVKNTLAELALARAGLPAPAEMLKGPTAAGLIEDDIAGAVRAMTDFATNNRELVIKGGQASQRLLSAQEVTDLVSLPSRDVLLARTLGGLNAPITGFVTVLAGTLRGVLNVLQAQAKKMEGAGA